MTKPDVNSIRSRLREAVIETVSLIHSLEEIIGEKPSQPTKQFTGKTIHSQPPWFAGAANLILELHAESREMEELFRLAAHQTARQRGGSNNNTIKALQAMDGISDAVDDNRVLDGARYLERWSGRARICLGEVDRPQRLPRQPGETEPRCPFCKLHTLRWFCLRGIIRCIAPNCTDDEGRRPVAHMEISKINGDWILVWQDSIAGLPTV